MDVLVRNKKTKEVKTIPQKVYETFKHKYKLINEGIEIDQDIKKKELSPGVQLVGNTPIGPIADLIKDYARKDAEIINSQLANEMLTAIKNDNSSGIIIENNTDRVKLVDEYSQLSGGKKADGRWSDDKLKMKIEELKK